MAERMQDMWTRAAGLVACCLVAIPLLACSGESSACLGAPTAGAPIASVSQRIRGPRARTVDLLLVIDNSNSMTEEQASLAEALPTLLGALGSGDVDGDGAADTQPVDDLRMGVITTDMGATVEPFPTCAGRGDDGVLLTRGSATHPGCAATHPAFLDFDPTVDDVTRAAEQVACATSVGTGGCGWEQHLEAILKALTPSTGPIEFFAGTGHGDGANAGFRRAGALLAILVVSDEDDCSIADPEIMDSSSSTYSADLNLRCFLYPSAVHGIARYASELAYEEPVFAVLAGVPADLNGVAATGGYDPLLADPRMVERVDPTMATRLTPSCSAPGRGVAFPPRRLVELARALQEYALETVVQSLCEADLRPALRVIAGRIFDAIDTPVCLPRALEAGGAACEIDALAVSCAALPGAPRCEQPLDHPGCPDDAAGCCVTDGRQACRYERVDPASAAAGWYYDEAACGALGLAGRIAFTAAATPPPDVELVLSCLQPIAPGGCSIDGDCAAGTVCHLGACASPTCAAERSIEASFAGQPCRAPAGPEAGFDAREVYLAPGSPDCGGGICAVSGFSGAPTLRCDPRSADCVGPAEEAAAIHCTCRCGGPDPGAEYCACPAGTECVAVVDTGSAVSRGSYCLRIRR